MRCLGHQKGAQLSRAHVAVCIRRLSSTGRVPKPQQLLQQPDDAGAGALGDETSPRAVETRRKLLFRGMGGMARGGGFR